MSTSIDLASVESSLLTRLGDLHVSAGGPVRTLRGYAGPWQSARSATALALPALLVRWAGWRPATRGGGQMGGWSRWIVTVAVGGGGGEFARRAGLGAIPSGEISGAAWSLLESVRTRLEGVVAVDGCGPFVCRGESPAAPDTGWAVWEQVWECSLPRAGDLRPLLVLARDGVSASTPEIPADVTSMDLGAGAALFAVGDPLFLSDAAGQATVYLGKIASIDSGVVQFARAPGAAYAAGSAAWSPSAWHECLTGRFPSVESSTDPGIETLRTAAGEAFAVRIRAPHRTESVGFGPIPIPEADAILSWIELNLRGGLDPFTWVDERGSVAKAWILGEPTRIETGENGHVSLIHRVALALPGSRDA